MALLTFQEVTQGYQDKTLYAGASFELYKGEHLGVVGQNGVGKSTLIRILTGEVVPDEGQVKWQAGIRLGHLDQYAQDYERLSLNGYLHTAFDGLYAQEREMTALYAQAAQTGAEQPLAQAAALQERLEASGFYAVDANVRRVAHGLGLDALGMERPMSALSGGQRAKAILAKLLLEQPDVLLLDEPTNFLDKEHVQWLSEYLALFPGAFIVVSHDHDFLEKIADGILDIEFGTIKKYRGNYTQFLNQKTHQREAYVREYQAQQRMIERTEAYIRKNIAGVNTKMAQGRRKQLERLERLAPPGFVERPVFRFREAGLLAQKALSVTDLEVGYAAPLLPKLNFSVGGGQKLVITGFNGIGKSTLLKTLVGALPKLSGRYQFADPVKLGYYEQDLKWADASRTPMQIIWERYPTLTNRELRRALSQCGVKEEHVSRPVSTLSGGEQSKVKLCRLLLAQCNFLILDEVTNHLDAEAKQALCEALRSFQGSLILVCHEEKFYRDWADRVFNIESCLA